MQHSLDYDKKVNMLSKILHLTLFTVHCFQDLYKVTTFMASRQKFCEGLSLS
jgi:hypothetical protein